MKGVAIISMLQLRKWVNPEITKLECDGIGTAPNCLWPWKSGWVTTVSFLLETEITEQAGQLSQESLSLAHSGASIIWSALVLLTWAAFVLSCVWAATSLHLVAHACQVSSNYLDVHSVVVIASLLQKRLPKLVSIFLSFVPCWDTATWLLLSSLCWTCLSETSLTY